MSSRKNQNKTQSSRVTKKKKNGNGTRGRESVSAPVSSQKVIRNGRPTISNISNSPFSDDGAIRVSHREYVADILGSVAYANSTFSINPGLATIFPWLASSCALGYESYTFEKLNFLYEPSCSTATAGKVILAVDYDPTDVFPSSKAIISSYHNAVSSPPWAECCFVADRRDLVKMAPQRYIRQGTILTALNDLKTFDVGNLQIGTQGMATGAVVGELWVEYVVTLQTPQINPIGAVAAFSAKVEANTGVSRTAPFGTDAATVTGSLPVTATGSSLTFNTTGQWLVEILTTGTGITAGAAPTVGGTGQETTVLSLYTDAASTIGTIGLLTNITVPGQTLSIDYTAAATTITDSVARIAPYVYAFS